MQVKVNCKTDRLDFAGDYRGMFADRLASPKSFMAEMEEKDGIVSLVKNDNGQCFEFDSTNVTGAAFHLDDQSPKAELIRRNGNSEYSFVVSPAYTNDELGASGVFAFKDMLDNLAGSAGITVGEYIDPNGLDLCPDGVESMAELIAIRDAEIRAAAEAARDDAPAGDPFTDFKMSENAMSDDDFDAMLNDVDGEQPAAADEEDGFSDYEPAAQTVAMSYDDISNELEKTEEKGEQKVATAEGLLDDFLLSNDLEIENKPEPAPGETAELSGAEFVASIASETPEMTAFDDLESEELLSDSDAEAAAVLLEDDESEGEQGASEKLAQMQERLASERARRAAEATPAILENPGPITMDVAETITKSAPQDADDAIAMLGQLFAAKRSEQALVVSASGKPTAPNPADDIVSGLINRIQEQTAEFDALNASYRKQQAMTRHYQEQLADATSANADKDKEIDELRRQVRFSQENQRKSEKFVSDARAETRKLIQESDDKVKTALSKISKMRKRVNAAEAERDAATEGEKKALMERAEAVMQAEEARRALEEEQAKSEAITEEFNKQLDSFTSETLEKLQAEVDKSSAAEQSYMTSLKHIAQLERDMAESKTRFAEELAAAEQNADTRVADAVAEGKAALVGMVPGTKLEEALGQVEELTGNLGDIAKERDELQEQYKSARLLIDELNESLVRQEEEFEEYKKDAESRLEDAEAFQGRRDEARVAQEQSAVMVSSMIGMARDHENYKAATEQLLSDISSVFVDAEEDPRGELIASSIESYRDSIAEFARASKAGM